MDIIAAIVKGLSEAQRRAILGAPKTKTGFWVVLSPGCRATTLQALKRQGIISNLTFLTPLGLAVRAALQGEPK